VPTPGFDLTVRLGANAPTTKVTLQDPAGGALDAVVSALSPWNFTETGTQTQAQACEQAPWIDPVKCSDPDLSSGPALIEAVNRTNPATGFVELGHANTTPIVLEAITVRGDLTFFATIDQAIGGTSTVQMAPGMCTIAQVSDDIDSSVPDVDIQYTEHSVGMEWLNAVPTAIKSTLIVRAEVHATSAGGAGRYDLSWLSGSMTNALSARADFVIPSGGPDAGPCPAIAWSGNGLSSLGTPPIGYCAKSADQTGVLAGRTAFTLYFVVLEVPTPIADAWYTLNTAGDGVDPSKATNYRAGISFNGDPATDADNTLDPNSCPVRQNNDGRYDTFRLRNNDGRYDTF
jgi:hypothetical protein